MLECLNVLMLECWRGQYTKTIKQSNNQAILPFGLFYHEPLCAGPLVCGQGDEVDAGREIVQGDCEAGHGERNGERFVARGIVEGECGIGRTVSGADGDGIVCGVGGECKEGFFPVGCIYAQLPGREVCRYHRVALHRQ